MDLVVWVTGQVVDVCDECLGFFSSQGTVFVAVKALENLHDTLESLGLVLLGKVLESLGVLIVHIGQEQIEQKEHAYDQVHYEDQTIAEILIHCWHHHVREVCSRQQQEELVEGLRWRQQKGVAFQLVHEEDPAKDACEGNEAHDGHQYRQIVLQVMDELDKVLSE